MGRITIFSTSDCPHCMKAKGALILRQIPYEEIDLLEHPHRRNDMLILSDQFSVPQIFMNETHVGGADALLKLLEEWDGDADRSSFEIYQQLVAKDADPNDERLALQPMSKQQLEDAEEEKKESSSSSISTRRRNRHDDESEEMCVKLPNGTYTSVLQIMMELDALLESDDRKYNAHCYKNCFVNTDGVSDIMMHFEGCQTRQQAVIFGVYLQTRHSIFHHVCGDHEFRDDGFFFFRLQCYHEPDVLNSFRIWNTLENQISTSSFATKQQDENDKDNVNNVITFRMKKLLYKVLSNCTDHNGLVDYVQARKDKNYPKFEESTCELQGVDMGKMDERARLAFGLNLYNLFITYAFIKMGIGTNGAGRGAFFSKIKMNIGGAILSFNDLEHGILRANTRHPYALSPNFSKDDSRIPLALSTLDPRLHFGLNCGAKSCPPVKYFHPESLEEELRVVAMSFCEKDDVVLMNEAKNEVTVSMLLKWYEKDFCDSKDELPKVLLQFLRGKKQATLQRMMDKAAAEKKAIGIKHQPYDWSANASNFEPYSASNMKANALSPSAMLGFQSCMT